MRELRFHGKGGQGTVQACRMLARSLIQSGIHAQFIPAFGVERKGSPVFGYFRISEDKPIRVNAQVYNPDMIVVLDDSLLQIVDVFAGAKPGAELLINTTLAPEDVDVPEAIGRVGAVDCFGISGEVLGRQIPNTTMLGALAAFLPGVNAEHLLGLVEAKFGAKNVQAAQRGAAELRVADKAARSEQ